MENSTKVLKKLNRLKLFYIWIVTLMLIDIVSSILMKVLVSGALYTLLSIVSSGDTIAIFVLAILAIITCKSIDNNAPDKWLKMQWITMIVILSVMGMIYLIMFFASFTMALHNKNTKHTLNVLWIWIIMFIINIGILTFFTISLVYVIKKLKHPTPPEMHETPSE